jgi:hypothetical protein
MQRGGGLDVRGSLSDKINDTGVGVGVCCRNAFRSCIGVSFGISQRNGEPGILDFL